MAISREQIEEVINKADMVSIISKYVTLEKKGNDYKGLCPFHNDNNPSLSVAPRKKCYTCFSCHATGNVITFVQNIEHISFNEALRKVAEEAGVKLDIKVNPMELKFNKYYKIMDEASSLYEFYLNNTDEGKGALEYLHKRNLNDDIIKRFRIGLASSDGNILNKAFIESNKYLPIDLIEIGLIGNDTKNNRYYDLFKNRIMFPIEDYRGNIIGFSGRIYNSESNAKYMNSHENVLFKKSNILYNYYHALNDIKLNDKIVIFEGFMDVIAAYRANINNSVCTMGTSLTEDQVRLISGLTKNIILCYDGDDPGIQASKRAIKMFLSAGCNIRVCILPVGIDPDDYINKYGSEKLNDLLLNKNVPAVDYLYEIAKRNLNIDNPNTISLFLKELKELSREFNSKILENYIIKKASSDLNVSASELEEELKGIIVENKKSDDNYYENYDVPVDNYGYYEDYTNLVPPEIEENNFDFPNEDIVIPEKKIKKVKKISRKYTDAEERLIYCAILNKKYAQQINSELKFEENVDKTCRDILQKIYNYYRKHDSLDLDEFSSDLNELEKEKINDIKYRLDLIFMNNSSNEDEDNVSDLLLLERSISDCIKVVKEAKYQKSAIDADSSLAGAMKMADSKKKTLRKVNK